MNKLTIIGNLTRDPETRATSTGKDVCSFTVAVNRRRSSQNSNQQEVDFFRVAAWEQLGENCQKYLSKGKKVCVIGPVSVNTYEGNDGTTRAQLCVTAQDVEFLTPRGDDEPRPAARQYPKAQKPQFTREEYEAAGYTEVDDDDLPF